MVRITGNNKKKIELIRDVLYHYFHSKRYRTGYLALKDIKDILENEVMPSHDNVRVRESIRKRENPAFSKERNAGHK